MLKNTGLFNHSVDHFLNNSCTQRTGDKEYRLLVLAGDKVMTHKNSMDSIINLTKYGSLVHQGFWV